MTITYNPANITDIATAQFAIAEIADHLRGTLEPLSSSGQAVDGLASLGTPATPFATLFARQLVIDGTVISDIEQIVDSVKPPPQPTTDGIITWPYSTLRKCTVIATFTQDNVTTIGDNDPVPATINRAGSVVITQLNQAEGVDLHRHLHDAYDITTTDAPSGLFVPIDNIIILAIIPHP